MKALERSNKTIILKLSRIHDSWNKFSEVRSPGSEYVCVVTEWLFKSNCSMNPVYPDLYDLDVSGFHHYHNHSSLTTGSLGCYSTVIM